MDEGEQARLLGVALGRAGLTTGELWARYFSIGGSAGEYEAEAYLHGLRSLPALQRDLLAHAANELIDEIPPLPRAPFSDACSPTEDKGPPDARRSTGMTGRITGPN